MTIRTEKICDSTDDYTRDTVHRSAEYAGRAAAMITNLSINGDSMPGRTAIWEAEQEAWQKRQNAAIEGARFSSDRNMLAAYAAATHKSAYLDGIAHLEQPTY